MEITLKNNYNNILVDPYKAWTSSGQYRKKIYRLYRYVINHEWNEES